jgi:DHA1 family multidrug resistance protein-like MFS transporter
MLILACFGAAAFFLPQAFARSIGQFLLLRAGLGMFFGVLIPATNAIVGLSTPPDMRGSAYGLTNSGTAVGNAVGPILGATLAASFGYPVVFIATALVLVLLGLWVLTLVGEPLNST